MSETQFDLIIVGGGLGGLLTAALSSREGMKVLVLDQDKQWGGCLQSFSFQKTLFDSCVHYLGSMKPGQTLYQIFEYLGLLEDLALKDLDEDGFDRIRFGDSPTAYPHGVGKTRFLEALLPHFPEMRGPLVQYLAELERFIQQFPLYRLQTGDPWAKQPFLSPSLIEVLNQLIPSAKLRAVLTGSSLLYAGDAQHSPFYQHALVWNSYYEGPRKILPGTTRLTKALVQKILQQGGQMKNRCQVQRLITQNGRATAVETQDGARFHARHFVCAIHPARFLEMVDHQAFRPAFRQRIAQIPQTPGSFTAYLVLAPKTIPYANHNLYWHRDFQTLAAGASSAASWPHTYGLFFQEDPQHPGFARGLTIMTYMDYECVRPWAESKNRATDPQGRPPSYDEFKEAKKEQLIGQVFRDLGWNRAHIMGSTAATPLTLRDYTGTPQGGIYGWQKSFREPSTRMIAPRSRLGNLYFTGQNLNLHGVLGVSISAVATAAELFGLSYLLHKINPDSNPMA